VGNLAIGNVRVMFNANWVGVVSAKWLCAKRTGYEHLLVTEGTNQNQVHHLKKRKRFMSFTIRNLIIWKQSIYLGCKAREKQNRRKGVLSRDVILKRFAWTKKRIRFG
jgi:hypothetical protein